MGGQRSSKNITNTVLKKDRAKEVYLPDEMDYLAHRAILTAAKAKTEDKSQYQDSGTSSCGPPFFHCRHCFGEIHFGWENFKS